jgi:hypothetical protein
LLFQSVFPSVLRILFHMLSFDSTGWVSLLFLVVLFLLDLAVSFSVLRRFLLPCCRSFVFSHFGRYIYIGGMLVRFLPVRRVTATELRAHDILERTPTNIEQWVKLRFA